MQKLRHKLPPPNLLITFEAAGRHLSFTKAAVELNVSRVAVSQQIQSLEKFLGLRLFERLQRSIKLTKIGQQYHYSVSQALELLLTATVDLHRHQNSEVVNVGTTPGFMTYWLLPRLGDFKFNYPDINLRFVVSDEKFTFNEGIDVAVSYGSPPFGNADAVFLARQRISPTCSPNFSANITNLHPSNLLKMPLISLEGPHDEQIRWEKWFRSHGLEVSGRGSTITVNSYNDLVQAALDGQGFALIGPPLIEKFLLNGTLVQPLSVDPMERHAFYLLSPRGKPLTESSIKFSAWVRGHFDQK